MIADLKPYPEMKNSGVPWLGEVPEHWEVLPNRAVFTEIKERDHPGADMLSVTITKGVIRQLALLEGSSKKDSSNQDKSAYKLVRPGDIAYNKMRAWQGAVGVSGDKGIVSPAYVVQRPREDADPRYLHYLLRTPGFAKEAERWSYGITSDMWSLRPEHFKMIYSCLPPLPEQAAIVRFLDHADRRIRRYIGAKQKLIKLLEEQKQAIIHRAVTRGLDPDVRLKPSGVEWMGEVPEHWEVRRAKHLFREVDHRSTTGIEVLLSLRMHKGLVPHNEVSTLPITAQALVGFKKVGPGQIVMNRMRAAIGMFGIANRSGLVSPDYAVLEKITTVDVTYFLRLFKTPAAGTVFRVESKGLGTGSSGFMRLYTDRFGMIKLPVPPQEEQRRIVQGIAESTQAIERTEERVNREIALLREYRTRLIADVVTGKLDVREAAARLPDEADAPEPLDEADADTDAKDATADDLDATPEETEG
ncbi:MAG: restriction endonuclease subunit S [Gemmatimonadetes bacterium]|nr:restriction endonuclease subunit S [Gemmatimonadota bacterium]